MQEQRSKDPVSGRPPAEGDASGGMRRGGNSRRDRSGDEWFHYADRAAGFLLAFGLGFLALREAQAGFWIAIGLIVVGATVKVLFRAL